MPTRTSTPPRMTTTSSSRNHRAAALTVARWFRRTARPLPWREPGTTAWGVLLSEVMAQQTPVARVAPEWLAWIERWPTPAALAEASQADVLVAWGKLGYPRRALNLWRAAAVIRDEHNGEVPQTVEELEALPGVGTYTARAVLVFALGQHHPVVDTNVRRFLARFVDGVAQPRAPRVTADLQQMLDFLPDTAAESVVVNQGVMELGALVCTARAPKCGDCPVMDSCAWVLAGSPDNAVDVKKPQARFEGSDRQMRGAILAVLRDARAAAVADTVSVSKAGPISGSDAAPACVTTDELVGRCAIDVRASAALRAQFDRALDSLLDDGLIQSTPAGFTI